jgi:hypothetical protein
VGVRMGRMTTGIQWTDETWNPVAGCTHCSPGCDNCYAAVLTSTRLKNRPQYEGLAVDRKFTGQIRLLPERLEQPLSWTKPRRVFVNSMSDLFHADIPDEYIAKVYAVMVASSRRAHLPGAHEAAATDGAAAVIRRLPAGSAARSVGAPHAHVRRVHASEPLVGRVDRAQPVHLPCRPPPRDARRGAVPVVRTAHRPSDLPRLDRHRLGHRRRRIRRGRAAHGSRVGHQENT